MSAYGRVKLQDTISYRGSGVELFHDYALVICVFILCVVLSIVYSISRSFSYSVHRYDSSNYIEII